MHFSTTTISFFLAFSSLAFAHPFVVVSPRSPTPGDTPIDPNSITGLTCTSPGTQLVDHDINVALLSICGGISGTIEQCHGSPKTTTGESGTAIFTLTAESGTIDISKGRWEHCVAAARAVCGNSPLKATCIGGSGNGNSANTDFVLAASK